MRELHNDYPLAAYKIEVKKGMLSESQLKIADLYNILSGNVNKLVPKFFDKKRYVIYYENLLLETTIKTKKKCVKY